MNQIPNTISYTQGTGAVSSNPFVEKLSQRDPTTNDINYPVQKRWLNVDTGDEFVLIGFLGSGGFLSANWIQVNSSERSGFIYVDVTTPTESMLVGRGYVTNNSGGGTYTLPLTAVLGDTILVIGKLGISTILQNANQQILMGVDFSTITSGSATGTDKGDCIELVCITPGDSAIFRARNWVGNWSLL